MKGNHLGSLIKVNEALNSGVRKHYEGMSLQYVDVPEVVGITGACENVDTLFRVDNRLNLPLFITQTGQLSLEQSLQYFNGVFTVIHSGRDEENEDERHLRQFRLTEEEFDCTMAGMDKENYDEEKMFEELLKHIESAIKAMIHSVIKKCKSDLIKVYKQDVSWLEEVAQRPFPRIPYEEAVVLLRWNGFDKIKFGDDLEAEHEQKIIEVVNQKYHASANYKIRQVPVFITRYPKEIKFFNMKVSSTDPKVVLSADLILPTAGEAVGSAVREHDGDKLKRRLITSTMFKIHKNRGGKYEDFAWYVDELVGKSKTNPHAGYGIGNERVIQFILGSKDIRNCSLFSLLSDQSGDWDESRRGNSQLFTKDKKMVLLSIGRLANKKKLLPYIKKVKNNHLVFYATQNTNRFLEKNKIPSTLVYKISQKGKPNISDLLRENFFDLIINIPTRRKNPNGEFTDGRKIRKLAVETGTHLITDNQVVEDYFKGMLEAENRPI